MQQNLQNAQKKFMEAEEKLHAAKSLETEAFTVPQPEEAMSVPEEKASQNVHLQLASPVAPILLSGLQLGLEGKHQYFNVVHLQLASPVDPILLSGLQLGLEGKHQYFNVGLTLALCSTWLQRTCRVGINYLNHPTFLPAEFIKGLTTTTLQGGAQNVPDRFIENGSSGNVLRCHL
ncbi:unnamed protein product [Fraxinus pennsylvanica]|uniref:Uncharacterized protein n=1 Tax=Fraxinus pennsylvanica TaxID=56036 RepID=A0AAD2AKL3_9LAMI|nr:unnamed protein product [Fraxinus pennsylvanica]